jgi:hypothetical protein
MANPTLNAPELKSVSAVQGMDSSALPAICSLHLFLPAMHSQHDVHIDELTDRLLVRIQMLRYRTHRLRGWRALHGQIIKSRLPGRRLLTPKAVHRAIVIEVANNDEPIPIWVN